MAPDRHRNAAVIFRPPPSDREWLLAYARTTGRTAAAIMEEALARLRRDITKRTGRAQKPQRLDSP